ncbi:unnamed protein product [Darwinula stevensoni]|uniref:START domain-containing protein n=1 Tax=Darwinula stevensoni TaxID=69355 RepID=A0A7R9AC25_9CRUS|nr:unnamed protein product [Darwinula stevensoni]CAG0899924.1 unnamed protein product [Darwinula stevensoni]
MKTLFILELFLKTMHLIQDVTLSHDHLPPVNSTVAQPGEEKCESEGERALEKFRFNLERKDWALGRDYGEEGITVKSTYDQETMTYLIFTEALLDFESDWVIRDLREHVLVATADWNPDVKEFKIVQRLTELCWIVYQEMESKLLGLFASRDMVILSHGRQEQDAYFVSLSSTEWPGLEPRETRVRAEMHPGSGMSLLPDPERKTTRTLMRWVMTTDLKTPLVPRNIMLKFSVEACRQYVLGLRKYLSSRSRGPEGPHPRKPTYFRSEALFLR